MVTERRWLAGPTAVASPALGLAAGLGALGPPLIAGTVAFALARTAMLPGVAYWDTAEFQTVAPVLGTAHSPGFPTYVILGWLASGILTPFGEPAFRMNLFAGLSVAAAATLTVVIIRQLTGRAAIGVAAGVGLAATPLAWRAGTQAEPHALHLALVGVLLVLLIRWGSTRGARAPRAGRALVAAAAVFGLAAGNHSLTLLLAPAIGAYVLAVQPTILARPRLIGACVLALFGVLSLVYLELPLRAGPFRAPLVYGEPDTWDGFWYIALAQQFQGAVGNPLADLPRKAGELAALASRELGVLALLVPAAAIVTARRFPRYALLTGLAVLVTVLFAASYANADIERYYLGPLLMAWTWLAILAATIVDTLFVLAGLPLPESPPDEARLSGGHAPPGAGSAPAPVEAPGDEVPGPTGRSGMSWPAAAVSRAVVIAVAAALVLPAAVAFPDRHRAVDRSPDNGARIWLEAALAQFRANAVVVSWWSYSTPLWYAQKVEGRRQDVFIVDDRTRLDLDLGEATDVVARYLGQRPIYVIRANQHDLGLVTARFELRQGTGATSNIFEVVGPSRVGT